MVKEQSIILLLSHPFAVPGYKEQFLGFQPTKVTSLSFCYQIMQSANEASGL